MGMSTFWEFKVWILGCYWIVPSRIGIHIQLVLLLLRFGGGQRNEFLTLLTEIEKGAERGRERERLC
jgi:hypothetical protein